MSSISFEVITPAGLKFQADVYQVQVPTPAGYLGILGHHMPLVTVVTPGVIVIRRHQEGGEDQLEHLACAGGFLEVDGKRARLLADSAERAEDIDELAVKAALAQAVALRTAARDQVEFAEAVGIIEHSAARLKVADLRRRRARTRS